MPSSASSSLLLELQAAGENLNTWGDGRLNTALSMLEAGGHGITSHTLTANKTLTYTNFTSTDGTDFVQKFASGSDGSYVFTLGGYERTYLIWNASSHDQTVDCSGGGTSVTVKAGEIVLVLCDAVNVARLNNKTVTGDLAVSGNVSTVAPTTDLHAATKKYVDDENTAQNAAISASETAAAASAAAAATSETNAATSEANAAASFDSFDDRYLGAKASDPSVDNDGDALITGAIYWNTGSAIFKVWNGSAWVSLPSGTMGAQNANNVAITGGSITGITDLAVADGGTGASTASGARTNLGLGSIATQAASAVAITGGAIDGAAIGGTTPAAGAFTTLTASGNVNLVSGAVYVNASNSRVGFGTVAPEAKVDIRGASATELFRLYDTATGAHLTATPYDAGAGLRGIAFGYSNDGSAAVDRLFFRGDRIGLGTNNPDDLLHLYKSANAAAYQLIENATAGTAAQSYLGLVTDLAGGLFVGANSSTFTGSFGASTAWINAGNGYTGGLRIGGETVQIYGSGAAGNLALHSSASGDVGVGIATPSEKLHVNGNARVDGKFMHDEGAKLAIATGAITVTHSFHEVETEAGAASDDLDTINGGEDGMQLYLRAENGAGQTISITTAGNIVGTTGSFSGDQIAHLIYSATTAKWHIASIR